MGDVIHTLPTLNALRERFPAAYISWLVHDKLEDILNGHPALNSVIIFKKNEPIPTMLKHLLQLIRKLRANKYDLLLELQGDIRGGVLAWLSRTPIRLGFKAGSFRTEWLSTIFTNFKVSEGRASHIIDKNLNFARRLGAEIKEVSFGITTGEAEKKYIDAFLKKKVDNRQKIVILHPGAAWLTKRWPIEKYALLTDEIKANFADTAVIITYGPGERKYAEKIKVLSDSAPIVSPPTTLGELIALIERCEVLVASDTGPLHLAAALGKKVIGLYGPTDSIRNGPYGEGNIVIKNDLPCLSCWKKSCSHISCIREITASEVAEKLCLLLT
ncbi:MAG: Lipopolysaccharide core heptosyltransferase RfaQ [candidate division WS2 bacterium]|nr:Lipopolysaccharide core heptosyltransferase RfaQ [Candidatus Psychracetigena formicireducens]